MEKTCFFRLENRKNVFDSFFKKIIFFMKKGLCAVYLNIFKYKFYSKILQRLKELKSHITLTYRSL